MAATDFIHKSLIGAGSRDAVSNMLVGAGIGAAANTGMGIAQGDFSVIGNATSGALLGAAGGAAARHIGAKYGSGLLAAKAAKEEVGTGFQVGMMTRKVEDPALDFWGKSTDAENLRGFMPSSGAATKAGPKAGADTSGSTQQAPVRPTTTPLPKGTNLNQHRADKIAERAAKSKEEQTSAEVRSILDEQRQEAKQLFSRDRVRDQRANRQQEKILERENKSYEQKVRQSQDNTANTRMMDAKARQSQRMFDNMEREEAQKGPALQGLRDTLSKMSGVANSKIGQQFADRNPGQKGAISRSQKAERSELRDLAKRTEPVGNVLGY